MAEKFKKIYDDEHFVCPKCGGTLEIGEMNDFEAIWGEDIDYMQFGGGFCTKCGEEYDINIAYKFAYFLVEDK